MGLFDLFRRKSATPTATLRDQDILGYLLTTMTTERADGVIRLVHQHRDQIRNCCLSWQKVPEAIRADRAAGLFTCPQYVAD